ncbi:MAG: hypothetical protein IJU76_02915, partial [Desulfovibrionaceae bacterium]|nr:hypothetical protein [Desulfovibrionaceae bacterium]
MIQAIFHFPADKSLFFVARASYNVKQSHTDNYTDNCQKAAANDAPFATVSSISSRHRWRSEALNILP